MEPDSTPKQCKKQPSEQVPMSTQCNPRNHMQLTHEEKPTWATYPTEAIFNHITKDPKDFKPF
jgi:hypothetical protein